MYQDVIKELSENSTIAIIAGKRGSGKTATGCRLLEDISGKRKYALGIRKQLPGITSINDVGQASENSAVLVDEAGINYNSRDAMKSGNKDLSDLMLIARHKSLTLIFISQNTANIEINVIRQADMLILKEAAMLQLDMERPAIAKYYKKAMEDFKKVEGDKRQYAYVVNNMEGMIKIDLPSFWNEAISKSYSEQQSPILYKDEVLVPEIVEKPRKAVEIIEPMRRYTAPAERTVKDNDWIWLVVIVLCFTVIILVAKYGP